LAFSAAEHLDKARENERFAGTIDTTTLCALEWAVIANFYAALHYVQAYFAARKISFKLHTNRATAIARDEKLKTIYPDYRAMQDASEAARYEVNTIRREDLAHVEVSLGLVKASIQEADPQLVGP
jgi:hypothetical protein